MKATGSSMRSLMHAMCQAFVVLQCVPVYNASHAASSTSMTCYHCSVITAVLPWTDTEAARYFSENTYGHRCHKHYP
jgi:hypothetical protein